MTVLYLSQHIHYWTRKLLEAKALEIGEEYIDLIIAFFQRFLYDIFYTTERGLSTCHTLYSLSGSCLSCIFLYNTSVFRAFSSLDREISYRGSHPLLAQLPSTLSLRGCRSCAPQAYSAISLQPYLVSLSSWAGHQLALAPHGGFCPLAPRLMIHPIAVQAWPQYSCRNIPTPIYTEQKKLSGKIPKSASFTPLQISAWVSEVPKRLQPSGEAEGWDWGQPRRRDCAKLPAGTREEGTDWRCFVINSKLSGKQRFRGIKTVNKLGSDSINFQPRKKYLGSGRWQEILKTLRQFTLTFQKNKPVDSSLWNAFLKSKLNWKRGKNYGKGLK